MGQSNLQNYVLPDIEMYAGDTDIWEFQINDEHMRPLSYDDVKYFEFKLVIKDFGYAHRPSGMYFTITKTGECAEEEGTGFGLARFTFSKNDTLDRYGKYLYRMEVTGNGLITSAQGNLYITRNIDQ